MKRLTVGQVVDRVIRGRNARAEAAHRAELAYSRRLVVREAELLERCADAEAAAQALVAMGYDPIDVNALEASIETDE